MDGIHDMGGKQGYGAVDVHEPDEPFHHAWEGRMWAISRSCAGPDWTIDWWRHVRERIDPLDYLSRPYFDSWMQTSTAAFILSDVFTLGEAIAGHVQTESAPAKNMTCADIVAKNRASCRNFDSPAASPALFSVGDTIKTVAHSSSHHSRLPQYARSKTGVIQAYHGAHLFADAGARGIHQGQHMYTVGFNATELWGPDANPRDITYLDLWEDYFEQP